MVRLGAALEEHHDARHLGEARDAKALVHVLLDGAAVLRVDVRRVGAVLLAEEVQMEEGLVCWFEILIARRDRRISKMPSQNLAQFGMCICQLTTTQSEYSLNLDYFSMPCDL